MQPNTRIDLRLLGVQMHQEPRFHTGAQGFIQDLFAHLGQGMLNQRKAVMEETC